MIPDSKKILMIMPALPFPHRGAEQLDRAYGIKQLIRLGHDVRVIAKLNEWQTPEFVKEIEKKLGIKIIGVPYKYSNKKLSPKEKVQKFFAKFKNPLYLDGAAFEYSEQVIQKAVEYEIINWKPDIAWFEYTYLWPLYHIPKKYGVRIITRSINFEPSHFIEEDGKSPINLLKYIPKYIGEMITLRSSDVILSITPKEEKKYKELGAKKVINLPLRALPMHVDYQVENRNVQLIKVFFMGSTYTVAHNKEALRTVIAEIAPMIFKTHPKDFKFYILGNKFPPKFNHYVKNNVEYAGFQEDLDVFLKDMDVALIPSLFGAGMQQKIFESLTRGFPTITSQRGIGDYPFFDKQNILFAKNVTEFCDALISLKDFALRKTLSISAKNTSKSLFSSEKLDEVVSEALSIQKGL